MGRMNPLYHIIWIISLHCLLEQVVCQNVPEIVEVPYDEWLDEIEMWKETLPDRPDFALETAWLTVKSTIPDYLLDLYLQHDQCFGCEIQLTRRLPASGNDTLLLQTSFGNHVQISSRNGTDICRSHVSRRRERGEYWLIVFDDPETASLQCNLVLANDPPNYKLPILYAFLVAIGLAVIWIIAKKLYTRGCCCEWRQQSHDFNSATTLELSSNFTSRDTITQTGTSEKQPQQDVTVRRKKRLCSLDTFRGLSLVVMIFVNYGGGGYWFFNHALWDGLLVADLVFPWFTWIMGTSITLSFRGQLKRGVPRWRLFLNVLERSVKIFAVGLFMMSRNSPDMKTIRILGVLQRLALTYFVTAGVHVVFVLNDPEQEPKYAGRCHSRCSSLRDIVDYWPEWLVMFAILATQIVLTYCLPVPGCPTGYVGPGGLHDGGQYYNCSGGAAAYIDKVVLGDHMYQWPTYMAVYKGLEPFDPEGILGTLTSIFMCYLGLQAGKIISTYQSHSSRVVRWLIWAVITGVSGTVLCKASQTDGWVPLNKNLWSVSFILTLSAMAFILLAILYLIIDVGNFWTGAPFKYPGMNSIAVYFCQSVFSGFFPIAWEWPDYSLHWQRLFYALWGCAVWTVMAYWLYLKKIFIAL